MGGKTEMKKKWPGGRREDRQSGWQKEGKSIEQYLPIAVTILQVVPDF